jgi:hypothetical protein
MSGDTRGFVKRKTNGSVMVERHVCAPLVKRRGSEHSWLVYSFIRIQDIAALLRATVRRREVAGEMRMAGISEAMTRLSLATSHYSGQRRRPAGTWIYRYVGEVPHRQPSLFPDL